MRIVNIDIAVSNGLLNSTVNSLPKEYSQYTLGTQQDHEAQKFVFTRPEEYAEYDLILHFESGQQPYTIHLGDANEYVIPNALTQSKELRFQVSFARGDEYLESDAPTMFFLRPKLKDGGEPEPIPSPIDELFDLAVATLDVDENRNLIASNNAGRAVSIVPLPGGGGGSDDIWKPTVDENGNWSSALSTSKTPPEPRNIMGPKGDPGKDAVSPTATVHKEGDTATITITDVNGTTTTVISDGEKGDDGDSPSATVTQTATGARIEITDKDGTTITEVSNGADGGDGVSPSVDVVEISGGHIVTITDADGTESFQVMDGGKGDPGQAATIEIGTVTTGEPGTDAVVENVGTDTAAVLKFTIPRGADGGGGSLRTEFYVSPFGSDETGDGTEENPWQTIQFAVDYISATSHGAIRNTLYLADGTYSENVSVHSVTIDIIGNVDNPANVVLTAPSEHVLNYEYWTMAITITGIRFINAGGNSFRGIGNQYCNIANCIFHCALPAGRDILCSGSSVRLSNVRFSGIARDCIFQVTQRGLLAVVGDCFVENSMTVTAIFMVQAQGDVYISSAYSITKITGTITGKAYDVTTFGRFFGTSRVPATTAAGTTTTGGAVQP